MPGPLDYLKKLGSAAITPMVDQETIAPYQNALDAPTEQRSPWEARLRGFGAGAMEGVRQMTSPLEMGSMMLGGGAAFGAMKGAGRAGKALSRIAPTMDLIEPQAVKQVAPAMDDVSSLTGDMQRNLARIPSKRPPMPVQAQGRALGRTLGDDVAEYTPRGGEAAYNAGREAPPGANVMDAYTALMKHMGGKGR